uniref:Laminin subunit beta-2-like n=1 Tax=Callorhinchus milii TaxID=7868 RepID=A0A4W3JY45_CALMI
MILVSTPVRRKATRILNATYGTLWQHQPVSSGGERERERRKLNVSLIWGGRGRLSKSLTFSFPTVTSGFAQEQPSLPHGCTEGSCYPATGNLLIGRAPNLTATSTCGLQRPTDYCIVSHLQGDKKCFQCNSLRPSDPNSHRVENVVYLTDQTGQRTWWQSENGEERVSIQLNLEAEFHFTHLIMKFKTFRPAAMFIERSSDFGRSWKIYRYFAFNCTVAFPSIHTSPLRRIDDIICEHRYSDIEPSTEGEVIYKVLDPAIKVDDPYSLEIQDLLRITNLRINFTKLHTLGDNLLDRRVEVLQKYYYAVYELVVRGSCFCYGHASECSPVEGIRGGVEGMIHGRCICKHNTKGLNCEQCKNFYHDLPWSPAEAGNPHACKGCNCNNHASRCHFDMAVYMATGNVSGGVCDDCLHHTMGRNCELCKPFYYRNPAADIRSHSACIPCDCDPVGSLEGGICDTDTDLNFGMIGGQCRCKENVRGTRCDSCKEGFYGLSRNDPQGCQACRCDPRGIIMNGAACDQISGDCFCKRYVTGRYCNQCLVSIGAARSQRREGGRCRGVTLSSSLHTRCSMEDGQCECRPNIIGRECAEVQPGFFCMPLDYYTFEAEEVLSARLTEKMVTWTGPGFARVRDGAGLVFDITTIPYAMEYEILLRYEPEVGCDKALYQMQTVRGRARQRKALRHFLFLRFVVFSGPFCFEPDVHYTIKIRFQLHQAHYRQNKAFILVDSVSIQWLFPPPHSSPVDLLFYQLALLPKYTELPGFANGDPTSVHHREEMTRYMCLESFKMATMPMLADMCVQLICSISAIMHDGALPCQCDRQGSYSNVCEKIGGQCRCKSNVMGRRCDLCIPGNYGFGPNGCSECDCSPEGSLSNVCDPVTGQCLCRHGANGRQCDRCFPGQWNFPNCQPCHCNGHSEDCHHSTGACLNCRENTAGHNCDRCSDGYYGNPVLGSGKQCRPCPCPGFPGSGHHHGISCHADLDSNRIVCNCKYGYTGTRCDQCAPGYHGAPEVPGGSCRRCQCNNNIDVSDPDSCDPRSGDCLKCLHNTHGHHCGECRQGYYGNALQQDCRRCTCNIQGTVSDQCDDLGNTCRCERVTGDCTCREKVTGKNCDRCAPRYWNFGQSGGCEPCACDPQHSYGQLCNMFSGQCECRSGFGGQRCSECREFYWGNPELECKACDCDPDGSESQQCHQTTGRCSCKPGFTGPRCDQCDRGYRGRFPMCARCHPCFDLWDPEVQKLGTRLQNLEEQVKRILDSGGTGGLNEKQLQELEEKLEEVQRLIGKDAFNAEELFKQIGEACETAISMAGYSFVNPPRLAEFYDLIRKYYETSRDQERRANATVSGPRGPVKQSERTRERVGALLLERENALRKTGVCGSSGSLTCIQDRCGGAGCRDDFGNRKCGGDGCGGALTLSSGALKKAENVSDALTDSNEQLSDISRKEVQGKAEQAKLQAAEMLKKANEAKDTLNTSVEDLRRFIKTVKDFLNEEGADPESIELVANKVLNISFPISSEDINKIVQDIRDAIESITEADRVLNETSKGLQEAQVLLKKAEEVRSVSE